MCKVLTITILFAAMLLNAASAPFEYPDGYRVDNHSEDGRTWRESVTVRGKYAEIKKSLATSLKKAGFRMKHDIPLAETPPSTLTAWEKGGRVLILMIFESSPEEVCFSWGYFDD